MITIVLFFSNCNFFFGKYIFVSKNLHLEQKSRNITDVSTQAPVADYGIDMSGLDEYDDNYYNE